ncbi:tetratricopeptide repeat protein [Paraburkholderia sp. CNPSo 3281]|uniref:O-linked N-acetylglucosamine transferase family protein n=1 Tax=Paraburkholderia sp. CNPSo 3281 TaxID=2940933 RepID=UPI0020B73E0F|nr:tetratricopeptide repeat protein [Paraburkholderia sp. CNPSo 3281]MCP3717972.1 tetratricopeptide repeat protein [Paraburkholderia sp. CNPSo 3281]
MTAFPTPTEITAPPPELQPAGDIALAMMEIAIEHHRKKEYAPAASLYAAVLERVSDHVDAHYHLGVLRMQTEQPAEAVAHFEAALGQVPTNGQIWVYYINALIGSNQLEAARIALSIAHREYGLPAEAVETLSTRISQSNASSEPARAPLHAAATQSETPVQEAPETAKAATTGHIDTRRATPRELREFTQLASSGKLNAALKFAQRLTQQYPSHGECWLALATTLRNAGQYPESVGAAERAADLLPNDLIAQTMLTDGLLVTRQYRKAAVRCRQGLERHPECVALHRTLGSALQAMGQHAEGLVHARRAVELAPNDALEVDALGNALMLHGLYDEAEATFRRALELAPTQAATRSNLLFCLMHKIDLDAASAFAEFREFSAHQEAPLRARWPKHTNNRNPSRRLKVGFVSGDLVNHPVAYFFLSVLEYLARDPSLSLHIYSNYVVSDGFTKEIRAHAHEWHEVFSLNATAFAQKIRDDGIDILIDLSGHTGRNRLVTFAHKPAPVQVSWIGNPATTGLTAIDYYMSDRFVTPLEQFADQFSEKLVFLPALAPFKPHPQAPDVNALPALKNGYLTFGSFSRLVKVGPEVVALWARVLREVPNSRMLIGAITAPEQMSKLAKMFADEGVSPQRIGFLQRKGVTTYLQQHNLIDVCLDAFPFAGSTTTMQALWMGVPTMTLPSVSMASRGSTGWLSHLGLDEAFVARDKEDFVRKCAALADDLDALATVRRELRQHCMQSPLIDASTIADAASRALRIMWRRWCDGLEPEHFEVLAQTGNTPALPVEAPARESQPVVRQTIVIDTGGLPAGMKPIRFVCGTRCNRQQFFSETALGRSLNLYESLPGLQLQLFDNNTRGLSSIYNEAIDYATQHPAILVFVHDDVWLSDNFWNERIRESLARFDVVGLAGNVRRLPRQPAWCYPTPDLRREEPQYVSGTVAHGKGFPSKNVLTFGPSGKECKLLDGLLLIADSETINRRELRFDEQFEFHFYDMDFCRQAELKGLRMGTWSLSVVHESVGSFGSRSWREGYDLYLSKYKE